MSVVLNFLGAHKLLAALVTGVTILHGVNVTAIAATDTAVVTGVVDGDTIDVSIAGDERRVRLVNVDAPESVHPDEPVECLGPEAARFLGGLVPVGTEVRLRYDAEKTDRYGRDLAAVYVGSTLVNAEIARAGLGVAVVYGSNDAFYPPVERAERAAREDRVGLYDAEHGCTLPAQVGAFVASVGEEPPNGADMAALEAHDRELTEAIAAAHVLLDVLEGDRSGFPLLAFTASELSEMRSDVMHHLRRLESALEANGAARTAAEARAAEQERRAAEEEARRAAEEEARRAAEEEARRAAEEEARRTAEEDAARQAAQKAAEREEATRQQEAARQAEPQRPSSPPSSGSSGGASSGGYDGYTGCRAYGGGYSPNAVDEQGRPYTKIDCTTKRPIG